MSDAVHKIVWPLSLSLLACMPDAPAPQERGPVGAAFESASRGLEVPSRLLMAVGWVETQWRTPPEALEDDHDHVAVGARGLMGVVERPDLPRLSTAADRLDLDLEDAERDPAANIRAAAFVLRELALETTGRVPARLEDWRGAVARYGSPDDDLAGDVYADRVFEILARGAEGTADGGEQLVLTPTGKMYGQTRRALGHVDFPGAIWVPARQGHFVYGRYGHSVTHVIIHTTEGSYNGAISWFRSPSNPFLTSAHYVVRSSDGEVTQMVREHDTGHHIGGWNPWTIGIEHEAFAAQGYNWFTEAMLRSSAAITRAACLRYGIPINRDRIRGHVEVPGATHVDPGPHFPWGYYMDLVRDPNNTGPNVPNGCGGLDYAGECQGSLLRWCEGGVIHEVQCANSGQACGWQNATIGNNCIAAPVDPCGGLDYAGECQGSLLRWCEGGQIRTFDCGVQGQACGWQSDEIGNNCIAAAPPPPPPPAPSECDRLGYAGECQGSLLRWCENGAVREVQCADLAKGCGWQDAQVGNNCLYTCDSLGYAGTCDGNVLRWCENGAIRAQSCGALGRACGYQNDQIGFNCL